MANLTGLYVIIGALVLMCIWEFIDWLIKKLQK